MCGIGRRSIPRLLNISLPAPETPKGETRAEPVRKTRYAGICSGIGPRNVRPEIPVLLEHVGNPDMKVALLD